MVEQFGSDSIEKSRQQLGYSQQLNTELQNQQQIAATLVGQYDTIKDNFEKTVDTSKELTENIKKQFELLKDVSSQGDKWYELKEKLKKAQNDFNKALEKSKNIEQNLSAQGKDVAQQYVDGLTARYKIEGELNNLAKKQAELAQLEYDFKAGIGTLQYSVIEDAKKEVLMQESKIKTLNEQLQVVSDINEGNFNNIGNLSNEDKLLLLQLAKQQKILDVARNINQNHKDEFDTLDKNLSQWDKFNAKVKGVFEKAKSIKVVSDTWDWGKRQLDAIGISFVAILKSVLDYGKTLTDAAKGLGISVDGVRELAKGYEKTAMAGESYNKAANGAFLTIKNQLVAQQELNKSLGTSGLVTAQARVDQVVLTKQMGLQADEAANIYKLGLLNKTSANEVAKTTAQQVINLRQQRGINLDLKQVLTDVGKVSGQLAVQYKNNPELLAKAVVQAKELGLTLEQTAKMGDKLLDFPGSIESELKAELLTGKALNLEQARYLALMGDSAGAAKELMNNVGGLSEFQNLNVLQQRALAEAVGMTADELSNSLQQQELLKGSAWATQAAFEEAAKNADTEEEKARIRAQISQSSNADQLLKQYEQISAQEKFNQAIEKLKEMIANLVDGPFGKFLDGLADAVSNAKVLKGIMVAIGTIIVGNMLRGIAGFVIQMAAAIAPSSAVAAANIASASALTLGIGVITIIAGLAAGIAALNSSTGENISVSQASGGATGVNSNSGAINVPKESSRPIVVENNMRTDFVVDGRTTQSIMTKSTKESNNKLV